MKPRIWNIILAMWLLSGLILGGCDQRPAEPAADSSTVLAVVNGTEITEDDLFFWLGSGHFGQAAPNAEAKALERLIETELLYQRGLELNIHRETDYANLVREQEIRLRALKRSEMLRRVWAREISAKANLDEEAVKQFYEANRERLGKEVRLVTMSFDNPSEANTAREKILEGVPFESLAAALPTQVGPHGGKPTRQTHREARDLGYLKWHQIPKEWESEIERLEVGKVSQVVHGQRTGIRLFKLIGRRDIQPPPLEQVRGAVMIRLVRQSEEKIREDLLGTLKASATIQRP